MLLAGLSRGAAPGYTSQQDRQELALLLLEASAVGSSQYPAAMPDMLATEMASTRSRRSQLIASMQQQRGRPLPLLNYPALSAAHAPPPHLAGLGSSPSSLLSRASTTNVMAAAARLNDFQINSQQLPRMLDRGSLYQQKNDPAVDHLQYLAYSQLLPSSAAADDITTASYHNATMLNLRRSAQALLQEGGAPPLLQGGLLLPPQASHHELLMGPSSLGSRFGTTGLNSEARNSSIGLLARPPFGVLPYPSIGDPLSAAAGAPIPSLHLLSSQLSSAPVGIRTQLSSTEADQARTSMARGPETFPTILHRALAELELAPGGRDIATFLPNGESFQIRDHCMFEKQILSLFFPKMKSFASFQRQLNLYDFKRVGGVGADRGSYHHELFVREYPLFSRSMKRRKIKGGLPRGTRKTKPTTLGEEVESTNL